MTDCLVSWCSLPELLHLILWVCLGNFTSLLHYLATQTECHGQVVSETGISPRHCFQQKWTAWVSTCLLELLPAFSFGQQRPTDTPPKPTPGNFNAAITEKLGLGEFALDAVSAAVFARAFLACAQESLLTSQQFNIVWFATKEPPSMDPK